MILNGRFGQVMYIFCASDPDHSHLDMIAPSEHRRCSGSRQRR
ncbi:MAG: hypothetical protein ACXVE9_12110 [Solirubrobacteraceae bacterium]